MLCHYEAYGDRGKTIVLTHGLAATGANWAAQVAGLAASHRVITWDLRGHGRSPSPPGDYLLADLARDLRDVLDAAGVDRAVVLGHSAGGVIAMRFALDFPDRTAGLVLVGTASECNERAHQFYGEIAKIAVERGLAPVGRRLGLGRDAEPQADPVAFAKVTGCMANLHREPLTGELARIHCPTLIVVGEKDFLGVGGSVILSRKIAGAQLEIVPGRGHGLFAEDPAPFNRLVAGFLARL